MSNPVPAGYKMTEVGIIPDDWEIHKLSEITSLRTGPFGSSLHKSDYVVGGIPLVNPMHIVGNAIQPTQNMTITPEKANSLSEFKLRSGDIVMGRRGDIGRCAVVGGREHGWLCGTGSLIIRCDEGVFPNFLQTVLSSDDLVARIENNAIGSTMINLNQTVLGSVLLQVPPLAEQRAIADALSDVDAQITALDDLIAKKRAIKQGTMQRLLTGEQRLPGFSGAWTLKDLGHCGDWKGGGTPPKSVPEYWANGLIPWVSSGDLKTARLIETAYSITDEAVLNSSTTVIDAGAIIIVMRSGILRKYLPVALNMVPMAINQDIKALTPNRDLDPEFLLFSITKWADDILVKCLKTGTTVESIEFRWLKNYQIPLPPTFEEQKAIASVLSDMDAEIRALEEKREKVATLKGGMMQELLTGKTRLI